MHTEQGTRGHGCQQLPQPTQALRWCLQEKEHERRSLPFLHPKSKAEVGDTGVFSPPSPGDAHKADSESELLRASQLAPISGI